MQLLCLHFAEALFMGLEAKVCPLNGLFSLLIIEWLYEMLWMICRVGWLLAWSSPSRFKHKISCFRFLPQAGRPVRYARNSFNLMRASETGLKFNNQTPFKVALRYSFAANRDKCNPELSLLNLLHFTRTVWEHASPCVPFVAFLHVFASKQHESCASSKD